MTIAIRSAGEIKELGGSDFVHSFFSTISYHLEPDGWGTRYPVLMNALYQGQLSAEDAGAALEELADVQMRLNQFPPSDVVWDIDDLAATPPWGRNISSDITSLGNYFVTSSGSDLIDVLRESISRLRSSGGIARLESF